tara:strand:- start:1501 stop:1794 length:294 start_codon:yes stop_codon:yes gene_type:complete
MKKKIIVLTLLMVFTACATHTHVVGDGPSTGLTETKRQYYLLFGLVPLNQVDTKAMVGDATDFKIETGQQAIDVVIGMAAGLIIPTTVTSRTVTVTK